MRGTPYGGARKAKKKTNTHAPPKTKDRRDGRPVGDPAAGPRGPAKPRGVQIEAYPNSHRPKPGPKTYAPKGQAREAVRTPGKGYGAAKPAGPPSDARASIYKPREAPPNLIRETSLTPWAERRPDAPQERAAKTEAAPGPAPYKAGGGKSFGARPGGAKPGGFKPGGGGKPRSGKPGGPRPPKAR